MSRFSQLSVVARFLTGSLASVLVAAGAPAAATAHAMTPATGPSTGPDVLFPDGLVKAPCQMGAPGFPPCYGPDQIRAAYDVQAVLNAGITGAGRTIVVIAGFQDPVLQADVAGFDAFWNLPAPDLQVITPDGTVPFDPSQGSWAREIATDVEWSHAIAPGAKIVLVLGKTGSDADIMSATRYAVSHNLGDVVSMSFSEAETCPTRAFLADEHRVFAEATRKGMTLVAASGDAGPAQHSCDGALVRGAGTPASDPLVTAVGGTKLVADLVSGAYVSETAWNDPVPPQVAGASGGGYSSIYKRPGYQAQAVEERQGRGLPDVAWVASAFGGVVVRAGGGFGITSGTSAATAQWAGVVALADQAAGRRLGALNTALYRVARDKDEGAAFHDITTGNNSFAGFTGFSAGKGWDPVTGLGTPDVARLLAALRHGDGGHGDEGRGEEG